MLNRRRALKVGAAGTAVAVTAQAQEAFEVEWPLIVDTNVHLFHWPFRRLPLDETDKLLRKMTKFGIQQAWAGSFEAVLHRDVAAVNERLANACKPHKKLMPVGAVNLTLPNWSEDLRRCVDRHKMRVVRVYPNYHGYALDDARFARLLIQAASARCIVQIAVAMEDARTQHRLVRADDVDLSPLPKLVASIKGVRVQLLNLRPRLPISKALADVDRIFFDTARVDSTDGVAKLVEQVPTRALFGTHAPLLIPEASLIRTYESGRLDDAQLKAVYGRNAERLLREASQ